MTLTTRHTGAVDLPVGTLATGLRIGGEVRDGRAELIDVVNPATGQVYAQVAGADEQDMDDAVRVAHEAFRSGVWSQMAIHDRARAMHRFADGIEARMADLYQLETMDNGRPITETKAQITRLPEWTATTLRSCSPTATPSSRCAATTTPTRAASRSASLRSWPHSTTL